MYRENINSKTKQQILCKLATLQVNYKVKKLLKKNRTLYVMTNVIFSAFGYVFWSYKTSRERLMSYVYKVLSYAKYWIVIT